MKKYLVVLSVKPAVILATRLGKLELNFKERKGLKTLMISKIEEEFGGSIVQTGLKLKVLLEARNVDEAINEAKAFADGVASFMTLNSGIGMRIPTADIAYEITAAVPERDFVQRFYDPFGKQLSRRVLRHEVLTELTDLFFKAKSKYVDRIQRAVRWYRLGAMTEDIFDQFNCFQIGLEALNPLLQNKLSVGDDSTQCPSCGHKWKPVATVSGIREFIQKKIPDENRLYQKMRSVRIGVMHSTKRLREMRDLVSEVAPKAGEMLFRALCYLM